MRRIAALAPALLAAVVLAAGAPPTTPAAAVSGVTTKYRVDGPWIRDEYGRALLLHGVNMVDKVPPWIMPDVPGGLTIDEADRIAGYGFNTVRLGVAFSGLMPEPGVIDDGYLGAVDHAIEILASRGIHVLVDLHQDLYAPPWVDWQGFPEWAVPLHILIADAIRDGTVDTALAGLGLPPVAVDALLAMPGGPTIGDLAAIEPDFGFPLNGARPSHALAWDYFWANGHMTPDDPKGVIDHLADALAGLAANVAQQRNVVGIEFINERSRAR